MGILDGERRVINSRIGALAGGATAKTYHNCIDECILTDIGFVDSVAVAASASNYITVSAYVTTAAGVATKLFDFTTGTATTLTGLATDSTYLIKGGVATISHAKYVSGKASLAATTTVADVACTINLGSRYEVSDGLSTGAFTSGVISTVKPEYLALSSDGYGYKNLAGIRIPAGSTLELRVVNTATSPSTFANLTLIGHIRIGRN